MWVEQKVVPMAALRAVHWVADSAVQKVGRKGPRLADSMVALWGELKAAWSAEQWAALKAANLVEMKAVDSAGCLAASKAVSKAVWRVDLKAVTKALQKVATLVGSRAALSEN